MTPEERERDARRAKWLDEVDDGLAKYPISGGLYWSKRFPVPDTSGMSPSQAEAVLEKWRAEVNVMIAKGESPLSVPGGGVPPAQPQVKPQAPVA